MAGRPIGTGCPLMMMKPCVQWKCAWWRPIQVTMTDPQVEGKQIHEEEWDCTIPLILVGQLDNARKSFAVGQAVESFRNEMIRPQPIMQLLMGEYLDRHGLMVDGVGTPVKLSPWQRLSKKLLGR